MTKTQTKTLTTSDGETLRVKGFCPAEQTAEAVRLLNTLRPRPARVAVLTEFIVANVQSDKASEDVVAEMLGDEVAWSFRTSGCHVG